MQNISKKAAQFVAKGLQYMLKVEANTASSLMTFQHKAPKELEKFRRTK